MPDIVRVRLIDGTDLPIDIEPLRSKRVGDLITEDQHSLSLTVSIKYFHPEICVVVETTYTQRSGWQIEPHRRAWQVIDEEWLIRSGYEKLTTTREFAKQIGTANAKYDALLGRAMKKGAIEGAFRSAEGDWWVYRKNPK